VQRLLERVEHEACMGGAGDPPPDDAPGIGVDHEGDVDEARPGGDVGEIGDPPGVRLRGLELPVHQIERTRRRPVADRGSHWLSSDGAFQPHLAHQSRHGAPRHLDPLPAELPPDLADTVDLEVLLPDPPDVLAKARVAPHPRRRRRGCGATGSVAVVRRRGDRQHPADRLDPMDVAVIVDERDHGLDRRSSSAIAKYALALRRISLAWREPRGSPAPAPSAAPASHWSCPPADPGRAPPAAPSRAASRRCSRSSPRSSRSPPTASHARLDAPSPSARHARALQASMSSLSSSVPSLHPLKSWSLRQTRRGSPSLRNPPWQHRTQPKQPPANPARFTSRGDPIEGSAGRAFHSAHAPTGQSGFFARTVNLLSR
jgi:hypothetical protein